MKLKILDPNKNTFWIENLRMIFVPTLGIKRSQELKKIFENLVIVGELRAENCGIQAIYGEREKESTLKNTLNEN